MKYRNKSDQDLIILGQLVKAGDTIEAELIENPHFEEVKEDGQPQAQAPAQPPSGVPSVQTPQAVGQQPAAPQAPVPPANPGVSE